MMPRLYKLVKELAGPRVNGNHEQLHRFPSSTKGPCPKHELSDFRVDVPLSMRQNTARR
jgi:hypothetical protein